PRSRVVLNDGPAFHSVRDAPRCIRAIDIGDGEISFPTRLPTLSTMLDGGIWHHGLYNVLGGMGLPASGLRDPSGWSRDLRRVHAAIRRKRSHTVGARRSTFGQPPCASCWPGETCRPA